MWTLFRRFIVATFLFILLGWCSVIAYHHLFDEEDEPQWDLQSQQVDFIHFILERSNISNEAIINQRKKLLFLYQDFHNQKRIALRQRHWLVNLAQAYKEPNADFSQDVTWQNLLKKVEVVPTSLVIAQAIEESGWGRSRFAKEGNNFFGMWCYTENCGLIPEARILGANHQVQIFTTPLQSVSQYMLSLNSRIFYTEFRSLRTKLRREDRNLSGLLLAPTLSNYSTNRTVYTDKIGLIIKHYHLDFFDKGHGFEKDLFILKNNSSYQMDHLSQYGRDSGGMK
jgi:Bax protein